MHESVAKFIRHCKNERGHARNSLLAYTRALRVIGERDPAALTQDDLRECLAGLSRAGKSAATVNQALVVIQQLYMFLGLKQARFLDRAKMPFTLPDPFDVDECERMLNAVKSPKHRAVLELLYACGLRASEVGTLRVCDTTGIYQGQVRVCGKGGVERIVPMGAPAAKAVNAWIEHAGVSGRDQLFEGMKRCTVTYIVEYAAKLAGVPNAHPHRWRHSFATHMLIGGCDLRLLQELMGHANLTTTQRYLKMDIAHLRATIEKFHPRERIVAERLPLAERAA